MAKEPSSTTTKLRSRITCPHCWHEFGPHEIKWVSVHPELVRDGKVGADAQLRFIPSRFNRACQAIDMNGSPCTELACPNCHLLVARALLELQPLFFSVLGTPGSGKSYFIASMIWNLRKELNQSFRLAFGDADPTANRILNHYEETLYFNPDSNEFVQLEKTQEEGDLYQSVQFGERTVWYPKPFVFTIQPNSEHPKCEHSTQLSRAVCLYDNAGEHFMPGGTTANNPVTQHLSLSKALFFLYDPTQHPRIRQACAGQSADPQMKGHGKTHRQDQVLFEAATTIRSHAGIPQNEKYDRPLIVVVTKYDAWNSLTNSAPLKASHVIRKSSSGMCMIDRKRIETVSGQVRALLQKYTPEFVAAAEGFSNDVTYIPVSALGHAPTVTGDFLNVRPCDVRSSWTEIPFIYALNKVAPKMVPAVKGGSQADIPSQSKTNRQRKSAHRRTERGK